MRRERLDGFFAREQIRTDEHVAGAVRELRAETRLAALKEHIKAPRPSCQSAYLCRISASVGFDVDRATAGGS